MSNIYKRLPNDILSLIFSYDSTYKEIFSKSVISELKKSKKFIYVNEYQDMWKANYRFSDIQLCFLIKYGINIDKIFIN